MGKPILHNYTDSTRLEPPLVVTKEQIDQVVDALEEIFQRHRSFVGMALATSRTALSSIFKK
jgi:putrescine aminotransferase